MQFSQSNDCFFTLNIYPQIIITKKGTILNFSHIVLRKVAIRRFIPLDKKNLQIIRAI